jgi:hypothetical protein
MQQHLTQNEAVELQLDSYVMHIHNTHCARCDSGERYGAMWEVWTHPTKTRTSGFRQLVPHVGPLRDLPIAYIEMAEETIFVCSDCINTYASHSAPAPVQVVSPAAWAETLKRKYAPAAAEVKIARKSTPHVSDIPSLDDL